MHLQVELQTLDITLVNAPFRPFFFLSGLLFKLSSDSYMEFIFNS